MNARKKDKPRICFVAHNALGELSGAQGGHVGGVERQTALMAKWLAAGGCKVSMATWDESRHCVVDTGEVEHIPLCRRNDGVWGLRFFHPRWTSLHRALRVADADVYYHNCGEYVTGQVALWCKRRRRKFVYSVANDTDCDHRLPEMRSVRERLLYRYGLRQADAVVTQTRTQHKMLVDGFGRESVVIPMPCPGPLESEYVPPRLPVDRRPRVLWIGRLCRQKRPDRLLDVAAKCPEFDFDMVGPVYPSEYAQAAAARAEEASNVTLHGPVSRKEVPRFYKQATCLVSTSDFEGFPNTFLEGWSYGLPVISTFDPDRLLATEELGVVADQTDGVVAALKSVLSDPERFGKLSGNARRYYMHKHTLAAVMPRFRQVFADVLGAAWW